MTGEQNQEKPVRLMEPLPTEAEASEPQSVEADSPPACIRVKARSPFLGLVTILIAFGWLWAIWFPLNREVNRGLLGYGTQLIQWDQMFSFVPPSLVPKGDDGTVQEAVPQLTDDERRNVELTLSKLTVLKYVWLGTGTFTAFWLAMAGASGLANAWVSRRGPWYAPIGTILFLSGACATGFWVFSKSCHAMGTMSPDVMDLVRHVADQYSTLGLVTGGLVFVGFIFFLCSSWGGKLASLSGLASILLGAWLWLHAIRYILPDWFLLAEDKPGEVWEIAFVSCSAVLGFLLAGGLTRGRSAFWFILFLLAVLGLLMLPVFNLLAPFPAIGTWTIMLVVGLAAVCLGVLVSKRAHVLFLGAMPLVILATVVTAFGIDYGRTHQALGEGATKTMQYLIPGLQSMIFWIILIARPRGRQPVPETK